MTLISPTFEALDPTCSFGHCSCNFPILHSCHSAHAICHAHCSTSKFSTYELDVHLDVTNVLGQLSPGTLNGDGSGLDGNGDTFGNDQRLDGRDVLHFELCCTVSKSEFEVVVDGEFREGKKRVELK